MSTTFRATLCALIVGTALAACGSAPDSQPENPENATSEAPAAEHGGYAHCLSEHGVTEAPAPALGPAPGPAAPPPGVDPAVWEQAQQSCAELAPGPAGG